MTINNQEKIKEIVRDKYGKIAKQKQSGCCSSSCCSEESLEYTVFKDDDSKQDGYLAEADLGLGCGLPTQFAGIRSGDTVVDLGSGAGNDVFVARSQTGALQQEKYLSIIQQAGFKNVEVQKTKEIDLPDKELTAYLNAGQIAAWRKSETGIFSITVTGNK